MLLSLLLQIDPAHDQIFFSLSSHIILSTWILRLIHSDVHGILFTLIIITHVHMQAIKWPVLSVYLYRKFIATRSFDFTQWRNCIRRRNILLAVSPLYAYQQEGLLHSSPFHCTQFNELLSFVRLPACYRVINHPLITLLTCTRGKMIGIVRSED